MAGRSQIEQAKERALTYIVRAKEEGMFQLARQAVYDITKAANARRSSYKSQPKIRKLIHATEDASWELVKAMDRVLAHWSDAEKHIDSILVALHIAVQHIDGTPITHDQEELNPDAVERITETTVAAIDSKLNLPKPTAADFIGRELATKVISPGALRFDPNEPVSDPDDVLDPVSSIPEPAAPQAPIPAAMPATYDHAAAMKRLLGE